MKTTKIENDKSPINAKILQLQEELKTLNEKKITEDRQHYEKLGVKISELPKFLELKDLDEVRQAIVAHQKGTLQALATGGSKRVNKRLTPEDYAKIDEMLKAKKNSAEIVAAMGCSLPTIQARKKKLGLVNVRAPKAPASV